MSHYHDGRLRGFRAIRSIKSFLVVLLLVSSVFVLAFPPVRVRAATTITWGPYLQNLTINGITICWQTDVSGTGIVHYSIDSSYSDQVSESVGVAHHELSIQGLLSNTTYHYYVETGTAQSPNSTFRTPPTTWFHFTFGAYGDVRENATENSKDLGMMHSHNPAFYFNTGDLTDDGKILANWDPFFTAISPFSNDTVFWPVLGNHEGTVTNYAALFSLPNNERWYSFNYGNAHFIGLDTALTDSNISNGSPQNNWLRADLSAAANWAEWIFVFFHDPLYSSGIHGSNLDLRAILNPIFERYNVTAVFNGHDHDYEHAYPGNGIHYFVTGGGGAPLYPVGTSSWTMYSEMTYHFMTVDINDCTATIKTFRDDDSLMEITNIDHDCGPPAAVTDMTAGNPLWNSLTLKWTAPGDDGHVGTPAGYVVKYSRTGSINKWNWANSTTYVQSWVPLTANSPESRVITGLSPNTKYWFAIKAYDELQKYGNISNSPSGATLLQIPTQPLNLTATPGKKQVTLTWSAPESDGGLPITNYSVYKVDRDGSYALLATIGDVLSYTDKGLTDGVTYYYKVAAVNINGEGPNSTQVHATPASWNPLMIIGNPLFWVAIVIIDVASMALLLYRARRKRGKRQKDEPSEPKAESSSEAESKSPGPPP